MIVIVNWNLKEKIIECLKSVYRMNYPCRIVVVDNCSRDGSIEYITDHFPNVELLVSPRNLGFAVACNVAIRKGLRSGVSYFLLLNNDTTVHENMLSELIAAAETHPEAGIFGSQTTLARWCPSAAVGAGRC
jgi:GT2 family glycosyltransferase